MNQKQTYGSRVIAALLLFSIAQITMAIPQQVVARLTSSQPITVNGLSASTGASILSGATLETGADQSATVNLGPLGSVDIKPNTKLVLTYDDQGNVKVLIISGCAVLTAAQKTTGELATEQATVGKTDPAVGGVLSNCPSVPPPAPVSPDSTSGGLFGLGVPATIAIFAGIGAAALTPLFFQDNPSGSAP